MTEPHGVRERVDRLVADGREAIRLGCWFAPMKEALTTLKSSTGPQDRARVSGLVHEALRSRSSLGAFERAAAKQAIETLDPACWPDGDRQALLAIADSLPVSAPPTAGRIAVPLALTPTFLGRTMGAVHTVVVSVLPWGGDVSLVSDWPNARQVLGSLRSGASAAKQFLRARGLPSITSAAILRDYSANYGRPELPTAIAGDSLGLAGAMAFLSAALDLPVAEEWAFTGAMDVDGRLRSVGDVAAKLNAASDAGRRRLAMPAETARDVSGCATEAEPVACGSLDEVAQHVFGSTAIAAGVERIRAMAIPPAIRERRRRMPADGDAVLFSMVGKSDPIGTLKDEHGRPIGTEEGPHAVA